jgi:hypothetical protein
MGGAGVEESQEARALEHHGHDHRVLRTDAHECMKRDHACSGRSDVMWRQVVVWLGVRCSVHRTVLLHVEVDRLQVEESFALVASDVGLIVVEAQALVMTFLLLRRREATKLSDRRQGSRSRLWSAARRGRGLGDPMLLSRHTLGARRKLCHEAVGA